LGKLTYRIGFVSTRLTGTDGVSLEAGTWVKVITDFGHDCFCYCGESDWPSDKVYLVPEAHFKHPEIEKINAELFEKRVRTSETARNVFKLKEHLKSELYKFVRRFDISLLVAENALSLPMNIPLGLALSEFISETSMPTIGHHHDFWWERTRYIGSPVEDYLQAAFPATMSSISHVVINSAAAREISYRFGVGATLIPNVMDFNSHPGKIDGYANDMKSELGIDPDAFFILQPTRIVPRKRIECSIELIRWLGEKCVLVVSDKAGDEGQDYQKYLSKLSKFLGVDLIFAASRFGYKRQKTDGGKKIYSVSDGYQQANLITYPSFIEGFGNAFLETVYYRRPIVMGAYDIFMRDIQPKGFRVLEFKGFLDDTIIDQTREVLHNPEQTAEWIEQNYEIGRRYYSYQTLAKRIETLLGESLGFSLKKDNRSL
jgi:glycosyltransferase involved in cell wall biosynthesis